MEIKKYGVRIKYNKWRLRKCRLYMFWLKTFRKKKYEKIMNAFKANIATEIYKLFEVKAK